MSPARDVPFFHSVDSSSLSWLANTTAQVIPGATSSFSSSLCILLMWPNSASCLSGMTDTMGTYFLASARHSNKACIATLNVSSNLLFLPTLSRLCTQLASAAGVAWLSYMIYIESRVSNRETSTCANHSAPHRVDPAFPTRLAVDSSGDDVGGRSTLVDGQHCSARTPLLLGTT